MRTLTTAFLIIIFSFPALAGNPPTHTVAPGETLFSISRQYDVTVDQIREWNELRDNIIGIGQVLIVGSDRQTRRPQTERPQQQTRSEVIIHTVEPGQTLYRISQIYRVPIDDIKRWNNLTNNLISIAQELEIRKPVETTAQEQPIRSRRSAPPSVALEWNVESTPQGRFVNYTVSQEDSLGQLLALHEMDMYEFRALNPDVTAGDLRTGDEITLLVAATTQRPNPFRVQVHEEDTTPVEVTRYPSEYYRNTTTSGDLYNPEALTAAHRSLALGSVVYIGNPENGRGIFVHINDRTPDNRLVLSDAAFRALDFNNSDRQLAIISEPNLE